MNALKNETGVGQVNVRYLIISLLFVVTTINYADRATLSMMRAPRFKKICDLTPSPWAICCPLMRLPM